MMEEPVFSPPLNWRTRHNQSKPKRNGYNLSSRTSPVQGFCDSFGPRCYRIRSASSSSGHPIWKADVFSSYQAFAAQVAAASEAGKEPEDLQIMKVLPSCTTG